MPVFRSSPVENPHPLRPQKLALGRSERSGDPKIKLRDFVDVQKATAVLPAPVEQTVDYASLVKEWPMFLNDRLGDCTCLPAGTRIRMANGSTKPIEEIAVLDTVVSAEGHARAVLKTMARRATEVLRVRLWGHSHLRLTAEHPLLTRRGYVAAGALTRDDWVAIPKYKPHTDGVIYPSQYVDHAEVRRVRSTGFRRLRNSDVVVRLAALPETLHLTPPLGRLLGLFLAEGSTNQNAVRWTFGGHERETLAPETVALLESELGAEGVIKTRPNGTVDVVLCGKHWRILFEALGGEGAAGKTLHSDLWTGDEEFLRAMLDGWLAGDGHHRRDCTVGTTVSHALALDMYNIAQVLGLRPTITGRQPTPSAGVKHSAFRWDITVGDDVRQRTATVRPVPCPGASNGMSEDTDAQTWRKVRGTEVEHHEGYVFNLSVEGDESYIAEGIGLHNCAGAAHAVQVFAAMVGEPFTVEDRDVERMYEASGYQPSKVEPDGENPTDQGWTLEAAEQYLQKVGLQGHPDIDAGAQVALGDEEEEQVALELFGCLYEGMECPESALAQFQEGKVWTPVAGSPIAGGHCIIRPKNLLGGYAYHVTWGGLVAATAAFDKEYIDEERVFVPKRWEEKLPEAILELEVIDFSKLASLVGQFASAGAVG